jgi:Asp-tRNA(Asn)/Glu-tRNA(Gln) amidotransferase C subunit
MEKLISLETLANIEGATASEAIETLFETVRNADVEQSVDAPVNHAVTVEDLREDTVRDASDLERQIIINNFPAQKNNYLVVPNVLEE